MTIPALTIAALRPTVRWEHYHYISPMSTVSQGGVCIDGSCVLTTPGSPTSSPLTTTILTTRPVTTTTEQMSTSQQTTTHKPTTGTTTTSDCPTECCSDEECEVGRGGVGVSLIVCCRLATAVMLVSARETAALTETVPGRSAVFVRTSCVG